ncbi:cytochrome c peroxidase [Nannizzia gypsea CBS 118893]|uniref:Peroxidase n=1 Tax=Arthroderma gypseum (strain ATCC MYA-4604 / CBS 118893) TaxID=535722 RepID=E4UNP8_ARTGP|nr:cytochrome c peroxidase [Nannizzia gypsea CBS 118893]EFQ99651.1 cytochrome c peroxidase [Nannizzia gypsea CBS 118893]
MASVARTFSRALARGATPVTSARPSATRNVARFSLPAQTYRASSRRGYSTASEPPKSSSGMYWALGAVALAAGGTYYYMNNDSFAAAQKPFVPTKEDYQKVYDEIAHLLIEKDDYDDGSYGPVLVRLAWHASGTYCKDTKTGGSNGATMRFDPEAGHGANAGLKTARDFLEPVKAKFPWISYSDLWTLAGACAIQELQGPTIPWRPGRKDNEASACTPDGRLPDASKDQKHIRDVFGRMGFDDREMVALCGAHALGRAHADRSGYDGPWDFSPTVMTNEFFKLLLSEKWVNKKWSGPAQLTDNKTKTLMMLPTDMALVKDREFKKHVERYAKDSDVFFKEFSEAFVKLLELGVPFESKPEDRFVFKASE